MYEPFLELYKFFYEKHSKNNFHNNNEDHNNNKNEFP